MHEPVGSLASPPMPDPTPDAGWTDEQQVEWYLDRIDALPPRLAGERVLVEALEGLTPRRVLDLGCGDGRLAALVLEHCPEVDQVVAVDRSAPMLARARQRFAGEPRVELRVGDLCEPVASGPFDLVVSGFAIHHVPDERKREVFAEVAARLVDGGLFANLEIVASATPELHAEFLGRIGRDRDDPEDRLAPVDDQLGWMAEAGLHQVDCLWRWRGMALLVGRAG